MSSQGRDVDGERATLDACLAVDAECRRKFDKWQALAETRGCDAGTNTPRGGQTANNIEAIRRATADWARFVDMCVKVGMPRGEICTD